MPLCHYFLALLCCFVPFLSCFLFVFAFVLFFYFVSAKIREITCNFCLLYCFTWNKLINIYNPGRITFFTYFINLLRRALAPFWFADFKLRSLGVLVVFRLLSVFHCASLVFRCFIVHRLFFDVSLCVAFLRFHLRGDFF